MTLTMTWPALADASKHKIALGTGWTPAWVPEYRIMNIMEEISETRPLFYTEEVDGQWMIVMMVEHVMQVYESREIYFGGLFLRGLWGSARGVDERFVVA